MQIVYLPFFVVTLVYGAFRLGRGAWRGDWHEAASGFPVLIMAVYLLLNVFGETPFAWFWLTLMIASVGWCALEIVLTRVFRH